MRSFSAAQVVVVYVLGLGSLSSTGTCFSFGPALAPAPVGRLLSPPPQCRRSGAPVILRAKKSLKEILREEDDGLRPNEPLGRNLDPEKEFELNRGFAVDTLLQDYPYLLSRAPDFSIFRKEIILQDAQGFSISGLQAYQLFFGVLRRISAAVFAQATVSVYLMDKYGHDKSRIRLRWKIEVNAAGASLMEDSERAMLEKMGFEASFRSARNQQEGNAILEGISVYKLDRNGMISSHTIEITEPTVMAPLKTLVDLIPSTFSRRLIPDVTPY
mmetsp:Transcript_28731/g.58473  ORF Transcript_28731/g.58473 Transcript_28731/m.58473 type:complete len:272 (+) Transcript_28731:65-880(+)|eukprot:CAMPEP_0196742852 /NCGR_PEP_ID=MMETSP1091-20130531/49100_1 /TAXON_ID=302021 /ORGANISM="Rhodomonas sp., Strain CCMP768" /LENGTH=271 /DNA_ID=CAMNT_0042089019 /DNA_START=33 /DNA_END=848 /DNA_ORIENTATION=+